MTISADAIVRGCQFSCCDKLLQPLERLLERIPGAHSVVTTGGLLTVTGLHFAFDTIERHGLAVGTMVCSPETMEQFDHLRRVVGRTVGRTAGGDTFHLASFQMLDQKWDEVAQELGPLTKVDTPERNIDLVACARMPPNVILILPMRFGEFDLSAEDLQWAAKLTISNEG